MQRSLRQGIGSDHGNLLKTYRSRSRTGAIPQIKKPLVLWQYRLTQMSINRYMTGAKYRRKSSSLNEMSDYVACYPEGQSELSFHAFEPITRSGGGMK